MVNTIGTTPITMYGLRKNTNEKSATGKGKDLYLKDMDNLVFSTRQWHASGKPLTFPSGPNGRIHFMFSHFIEDVMPHLGGMQFGHGNADNIAAKEEYLCHHGMEVDEEDDYQDDDDECAKGRAVEV